MSNVEFNHMFMPTVYRCLTKDRCVEVCGELDRERVSSNPDGIEYDPSIVDYLDLKLSSGCWNNPNFTKWVMLYPMTGVRKKCLHVSNEDWNKTDLFSLPEWDEFVRIMHHNTCFQNSIHLEILNLDYIGRTVNHEHGLNPTLFAHIDYHHIQSDKMASWYSEKGKIEYNPKANRI